MVEQNEGQGHLQAYWCPSYGFLHIYIYTYTYTYDTYEVNSLRNDTQDDVTQIYSDYQVLWKSQIAASQPLDYNLVSFASHR